MNCVSCARFNAFFSGNNQFKPRAELRAQQKGFSFAASALIISA
jgi:hypothetical protein